MNITEAVGIRYNVIGGGRYRKTTEHNSLVIDTYQNTFYWNSMGFGGDVYTFLTKVLDVDKSSAKLLSSPAKIVVKEEGYINQDLPKLFWDFGKDTRDFWYKRGFTDAEIDLYTLGYFSGFYTIPFIMFGKVNAISLRKEPKIISEIVGSKKSLFGFDQLKSKRILIVESPLDVPLLRRFGYEAISYIYGANSWDHSWNQLFYDYDVTIIPDNDPAGGHILKRVSFYSKVVRWPRNTPKGFDVTKLYFNNKDKFESNLEYLLKSAIPINLL
jgi:hypothetical protein